MEIRPMVSIWCSTYNHENFIRDAIEGFLSQKVNFSYEIVIHDDASTDHTPVILDEYEKKYPDRIRVIYEKENIWNKKNRVQILQEIKRKELRGKYVAFCEGDDYWIDADKLQEQVDYMEKHPKCVMVAHGCRREDFVKGNSSEYRPFWESRVLKPEDIILQKTGNLPTASLVIKREIVLLDERFPACDVGDISLQLYAVSKGEIYYIDKVMSVYRYMHEGSWSKEYYSDVLMSWKHRLGMVEFLKEYDEYTERRFHEYIKMKARTYLYRFFMLDKQIETDMLLKYAEDLNRMTNKKYDKYIRKQVNWFRTLNETFYISQEIKDYLERKEYVVLMGTGEYSKKMTQKLTYEDIHIDGYVVSDGQKVSKDSSTKPIWTLKDYPYKWEDTGLLIAVNPGFQTDIEKTLERMKIIDYCAPYWLDM